MAKSLLNWIKKESLFCASFLLAVLTMCFVPPSLEYLGYIDVRVLALLFCLMAVVEGFKSCDFFGWLGSALIQYCSNGKWLGLVLVLLPFFCAMLITNDVALLTFVPFTMIVLDEIGYQNKKILILVLQTIAANLGSMATPVGNPQNLYLYSFYDIPLKGFFITVLPIAGISIAALCVASLFVLSKKITAIKRPAAISSAAGLITSSALFLLSILTVLKIVPCVLTLLITAAVFALTNKTALQKVDYMLLATFICFFIISGNLGQIPSVRCALQGMLSRNVLLTAVAASQVISNVPAAVLLSRFTQEWRTLLLGVNIGGLGTPIASLASLITFKLYSASKNARSGRFLFIFMICNIISLAVLLICTLILF